MKITTKDFELFRNLSTKTLLDRAEPLDEKGRRLYDRDFISYAQLQAALSVFKKAGIVSNEVELELNKENECRSSM